MIWHVARYVHSTSHRVSSTAMSPGSKAARSVASAMMEIDSAEPLADREIEKKRCASSSRSLKKMSCSSVAKQALTRSSAKVATCTVLSMGVSMTCVEDPPMWPGARFPGTLAACYHNARGT